MSDLPEIDADGYPIYYCLDCGLKPATCDDCCLGCAIAFYRANPQEWYEECYPVGGEWPLVRAAIEADRAADVVNDQLKKQI